MQLQSGVLEPLTLRPPHVRASGGLVHALAHAAGLVRRAAAEALAPAEIGVEEHAVLSALAARAGDHVPPAGDDAEPHARAHPVAPGVAAASCSGVLLGLLERGLVRVRGRGAPVAFETLELTGRGQRALDAGDASLRTLESTLAESFAASAGEPPHRTLDRVAATLDGAGAGAGRTPR